ncbi:MAG: zf-HC2 domain-containing protein, partial [Planctomycetota bacterium]
MNHLNEDKLIQYAFDLLDADERHAAQQHLDACGDCRNALAALKAKFAAMDTLADEVPPSEELIQQTLKLQNKPERIPLYRRRWFEWSAAAAAVALVCVLFLQNLPDTRVKKPDPMWAKHPASESGDALVVKKDSDAIQIPATPLPDDRMAALSTAVRSDEQAAFTNGVRAVSADEIPDVPPFAPASAIELVVLPKPDKTQVTIYNSKDLTLVRDTRKLTLKPGWNWLQFMWANTQIDPTSLSLTPLSHADKVDIQLISYPARLKDIGRWLIRSEVEG